MIDPRPGNATSNDAADNIALLDRAVERLPGRYRRRMLIRLDGAGFSHELLEHIAAGGNVAGRSWEFSAGWSCTDREMDAIAKLPDDAWSAAIEQNGQPVENAATEDDDRGPGFRPLTVTMCRWPVRASSAPPP